MRFICKAGPVPFTEPLGWMCVCVWEEWRLDIHYSGRAESFHLLLALAPASDWHLNLWNAVGVGRPCLHIAFQLLCAALQPLQFAALNLGRVKVSQSNYLFAVPVLTLRWDPPNNICLFLLSLVLTTLFQCSQCAWLIHNPGVGQLQGTDQNLGPSLWQQEAILRWGQHLLEIFFELEKVFNVVCNFYGHWSKFCTNVQTVNEYVHITYQLFVCIES